MQIRIRNQNSNGKIFHFNQWEITPNAKNAKLMLEFYISDIESLHKICIFCIGEKILSWRNKKCVSYYSEVSKEKKEKRFV